MANASGLRQRRTKPDTYITDSGDILRGDEATAQLIQKDAEEILKESGMREMLDKINTKKTNNESQDTNKTSSECSFTQCQAEESTFSKKGEVNGTKVNKKVDFQKVKMKKIESSTSATCADVSIATAKTIGIHGQATVPCSVNVEATGLNLKAAHADITGVKGMAKLEASASATGTNISVATTGIKGVQGQANASLNAEATGLNIKGVNADVTVTKGMAKVEASASATGGDISVGKADITGVQGQASATINAEAHGFNVKAANADISGAKVTTKIGASASVTGADITVAKADITGVKAIAQAEAKASVTGFEGNLATADITGVMAKVEKQVKAEVVGAEMEVGNASITGIKKGYTATAKAKVKGTSITTGNVDITGIDATVSTAATATVAAGEANLGNVRVGGYQGSGAVASAELKAGIDAGNINIGTHSTARVGVSTKVGIGNIDLSIGPPSLVLSPSLGFSLGGCGGGGGKESKTKGSKVNGPTGEGDTGNHEGSVGSHSGGYPRHSSGSTGSLGEGTHANIGGHIGSHSSINTSSRDSTSYYTGGQTESPMRDSTIKHCTGTNTENHVGGFHPSSNEIGEGGHINSRSGARIYVGQNGDNGSHGRHPIGDNTETGTSTRGGNEGIIKKSHIKESKEVNPGISGEGLRYRHSAKNKPTLDTAIGYGSTTRRPLDTKQSGPTSPYHQQLKKKIHDEIGQLPEIKGTEMPSKSVSVPLSREESRQQLKDQLSSVRKSLAKQYCKELSDTSDSKEKSPQDKKSDDDNNDDDIEEPPTKKPFGDQKNIYTIDMIVSKSTKKTKILQGTNVVGFKD